MTTIIVRDEVTEGCVAYNDGSLVIGSDTSDDGVLLTTPDVVGSITLDIYPEGSSASVYSTTLSAAAVISDTPIPWQPDDIGRNFRHKIDPAVIGAGILLGGRRFRMVYRIQTLADGILRPQYVWTIKPVEA